ncbi:calmodulin-regulated spectrin-associated protein 3-like isoform X2 [Scleropages formosus]|uniref:calmodulin-regulated spectrin-associated protein 3-like isoform X2 n=1 Tax=Scleropages formosus TaxID=113540 RepID=UPI0010FA9FC2|nr:calmodulin-regulated spectrin-associated protein 3-like isoform X2 [Scleropages formosus]
MVKRRKNVLLVPAAGPRMVFASFRMSGSMQIFSELLCRSPCPPAVLHLLLHLFHLLPPPPPPPPPPPSPSPSPAPVAHSSAMVDSGAMRRTFPVPEIKPLDQYDFSRAKICASVGWLLTTAYGGPENVPVELQEPFYRDQYEQEHVKPPVTGVLVSAELYCRVYGLLLGVAPPRDSCALLQLLVQKGMTLRDQDVIVTEAHLQLIPIRMGAHLAVIDALMSLGAMTTVSKVAMPAGLEQLGGRSDWENAVLYWINRLIQKLKENVEGEVVQRSQPSTDLQPVQPSCPTRWYWKLVPHAIAFCLKESGNKPPVIRYRKDKMLPKQTPMFPLVTSIKDLSNGCAIAAVVHYYCPHLLRLEDVCLKDTMSVADSLYNLQLIRDFCVNTRKCYCPLALEDLLYAPPALWVNIMSFMAELLGWFEVHKPEFVQPREPLDLTDPSGLVSCTTPTSGNSNSASPSFIFKQPFVPVSSPVSPGAMAGVGRPWTKKHISRPLSAVSFSIPFGLDSDVDIVMGNPVGAIIRSTSTDSLASAVPAMSRAPYTPPEDLSHLLKGVPVPIPKGLLGSAENELVDASTMEEAFQVIQSKGKLEPRLRPEGAPDGFYLHSPEDDSCPARLSSSAPTRTGMLYRTRGQKREHRGKHNSELRNDNLALRVGRDATEGFVTVHSTPTTPASTPLKKGQLECSMKMTSFAELKKKIVPDTPPSEAPSPPMTTWVQRSEESPSKSPALSTEMSELGAQLEEKRKSIEAQKQRIEAIFAKHRQRLGNSAFLQLQKQQCGSGATEVGGTAEPSGAPEPDGSDQAKTGALPTEKETKRLEERLPCSGGEETSNKPPPKLEKQVTFSKETQVGEKGVVPLDEYNDAVFKLNEALSSLQSDMQRLSEQQKRLMSKKGAPSSRAWVIPAGRTPPRLSHESSRDLPSTSSSPSPSRKASSRVSNSPKSAQVSTCRTQSAPAKSPRHQQQQTRPLDLKFPPLTRVLTPPQNVDTLPHLRKVSPSQCQVQTCSSFSIGDPPSPLPMEDISSETCSSEDHTIFSLDLEDSTPLVLTSQEQPSSGAPSDCSLESDVMGALSGPHTSSLIEVSVSSLQGPRGDEGLHISSSSLSSQSDPEGKAGLAFYHKEDEPRSEGDMAQRRAALLQKQQRRAEELKRRRQESPWERDARPLSVEEPRPRWVEERAAPLRPPQRRGEFTRQEYERRQQLKLMEDLEKVLRQRPPASRGAKKQRPKTEFRDDSGLSRSPAKGFMGSKLTKIYSQSSLNLSSMANDSGNGCNSPKAKNSPSQSQSPARLMSPCRPANQNGEKDGENGSPASSPASIPEYTGPKLFKEPSFKSNKFIIHNALSRCCLAGKVNEPQKNKIMEEMEKSTANHFLILFRDSSCQFRAVYTMNPETEELVRLAGTGPRAVSSSVVESMFKYSSDRKQFTAIPSKTMSMSVDAFTIPAHLWQSKRPGTPKKPSTPK